MSQPFLPRTPIARVLTAVTGLFCAASIITISQVSTTTFSAQLTQSDIAACKQHVEAEYTELVNTTRAAYQAALLAEKEAAFADIQASIPQYIARLQAGEVKQDIIEEVKEAFIARMRAVLPPFKTEFLATKQELVDAWYRCEVDTTINFHLDDLNFDGYEFDEPLIEEPDTCPIVTCMAPAEGCSYVADPTLNSAGCPVNPCGTLVCADEQAPNAPGCYNDSECATGFSCTAETECLPPPDCSGQDCPAVCYGRCVEHSSAGDDPNAPMPLVCEYNGIVLQEQEQAIGNDGCSICTCTQGEVSCNSDACTVDPGPEPVNCGNNAYVCGTTCCGNAQICEQDNQGNGSCYDSTPTCNNNEYACGNVCCNSTQSCDQDNQGNGVCYDPTPPDQSPPPVSCSTGETACGSICCSSTQSCSNGTCQAVDQCVATNRTCNQHADCCGDNICDERQKKCKRPKDNGTTCESSSECAGNSICEPDGSGNPNYYGRCVHNEGALCYQGDKCAGDNECIDSVCKPTGAAEGESCSATVTCKEGGGLQCKNDVCHSIVNSTPTHSGGKPADPPACRTIDDNTDQYRQNKLFGKDRDNNFADVSYLGGTGVVDSATNLAYLFESPQSECAATGGSCQDTRRIFKADPGEIYGNGLRYIPMQQIGELPFAWYGVQAAWDQANSRAFLFGGIRPSNDSSQENLNFVKDIYTFTPNGAVQHLANLPLVANGNTANNVVVGAFNPTNQKLYLIETGRYNTIDWTNGNNLGDTTGRNDNYTRMWIYDVNSGQFDTVNPPFIGEFMGKVSITYDPLKDKLYVFNTNIDGGTVYEVNPENYQFTQVANSYGLVHDTRFDPKTKQIIVLSGTNERSIQAFDTTIYRFMSTNYNGTLEKQVQILPFNSPDQDYTSLLMPNNRAETKTGTHANGNTYSYDGFAEDTVEFISILNCAGVSCHSQAQQAPVIRFYHNDGGGLNTTITPNRAVQLEDNYFALFANSTNNSMKRVTMYNTVDGAHGVFGSFPEEIKNAVVANVQGTKTIFATNMYNTALYSVTVSRNRSNPSDPTQLHFGNIRTVGTLTGIAADAVAQYDVARNNIVFFSNESGIHSYNIESNTLKQHQTQLLQNGTIADIKVAYLPNNSNGVQAFILTDGAVNSNGTALAYDPNGALHASLMAPPEVDPNPTNTKYHFVNYTSGTDTYYMHSYLTFNVPWTTNFRKVNQVAAYEGGALFIGNNEIYHMNTGLRTFTKVYDSQEAGFTLNDLVTVQNSSSINPDLLYSFAPVRSNQGVKTPYVIHLNSCQE